MLYRWKENSMLTNCLAECTHLTITVSQIERDIGRKSSFTHTSLHSTSTLGGFPLEYHHPVWCGKTRMAYLPEGKKISKIHLFGLTWSTNVTDGQTSHADIYSAYAYASRGKKCIGLLVGPYTLYIALRNGAEHAYVRVFYSVNVHME